MLAGDIPLGHESVNVSLPLYRDKKIKIIALTGTKRLALAPELPIFAETFPGFDLGIWQSVVAPAGTPKEIVDKLHASIKKVMEMKDVRDKFIAAGIEPVGQRQPGGVRRASSSRRRRRARRSSSRSGSRSSRLSQRRRIYFRFARTPIRSSRGSTSSQKNGSSLR